MRANKAATICVRSTKPFLVIISIVAAASQVFLINKTYDLMRVRTEDLETKVPPENLTKLKNEDVMVYNKVPKCGSSTLGTLLIKLSLKNNFTLGGEYHGPQSMSENNQRKFVEVVAKLPKPVYYQGHCGYVNFTRFNGSEPIYINQVRDPVDRIVSYYFFDRIRGGKMRFYKNMTNQERIGNITKDFRKCYENKEPACTYVEGRTEPKVGRIMINFFCGHDDFCRVHGNRQALEKAKYIADLKYSVIGVLEELDKSLALYEALIPKFFRGVTDMYRKQKFKKNRTKKMESFDDIKAELRQNMTMEIEFYEFVRQRMFQQYSSFVLNQNPY